MEPKDGALDTPAAFSALVKGKVQGVGFRLSSAQEARRLKLGGWVKNTHRGDVELWAEGSRPSLERFATWLRKGPPYSRVDAVELEEQVPRGYGGFDISY